LSAALACSSPLPIPRRTSSTKQSPHSTPFSLSAKAVASCTCRRILGRQSFSSSSSACVPSGSSRASTSSTRETGGRHAAKDEAGNPIGRDKGPLYREWLSTIGAQFKEPKLHATNWLGGKWPFPLNPTFKPPPPLSDALRNSIFGAWLRDPNVNNPRRLAAQYGISIKRVEAIIRLKSHQKSLGKNVELQTGFLRAWESATGVYAGVSPERRDVSAKPDRLDRDDAAAADYDADWEQLPSTSMTSVYWEPVNDNQEPVVPTTLERLAQDKLSQVTSKSTPKSSNTVGNMTFVDAGSKFQHTYSPKNRQKRREVRAERRADSSRSAHL